MQTGWDFQTGCSSNATTADHGGSHLPSVTTSLAAVNDQVVDGILIGSGIANYNNHAAAQQQNQALMASPSSPKSTTQKMLMALGNSSSTGNSALLIPQ